MFPKVGNNGEPGEQEDNPQESAEASGVGDVPSNKAKFGATGKVMGRVSKDRISFIVCNFRI